MSKFFRTKDGYTTIDLLHAAIDHLASASVLFDKNPRCYDSAGYLSHLGIELVLKSFLLHHVGQFPGIHSLSELRRSLKTSGVTLLLCDEQNACLVKLDKFAELRYPNPNRAPEIGSEDWMIISRLYSHLFKQLPLDVQKKIKGINQTAKFGRVLMRKQKNI